MLRKQMKIIHLVMMSVAKIRMKHLINNQLKRFNSRSSSTQGKRISIEKSDNLNNINNEDNNNKEKEK